MVAEGGASSSLRCFQSAPRCRRVKVITPQLKIKMSLGREQRLTMRQAKEGEGAVSIKSVHRVLSVYVSG